MARVLLIDKDSTTRQQIREILRSTGHRFECASCGLDGMRVAAESDPEIALIGLGLPDMSSFECLRGIRARTPWIACVIVGHAPVFELAKEALRAGAYDWIDTPIRKEDLLATVTRATKDNRYAAGGLQVKPEKPHAAARLAAAAVAFIAAHEDAPTLQRFGREVGHSLGCIRNWCSVAALKSKAFCDFSRALRSIYRLQQRPTTKQTNVLGIVDRRTLKKFVARSGGCECQLPATVDHFLQYQTFIQEPDFVAAVRRALKARMTIGAPESCSTDLDDAEPHREAADAGGHATGVLSESLVELESNHVAVEHLQCAEQWDSGS